ncbi:uncharacterized protein [Saccopteryx leptura]|uniref:uncharacterized protein n=1 Tax=Saccopteryx leptura TaxID=249018 RepID=UPI00339C9E11
MALQSPSSTAVSRAGDCLWATREKYETDFPEKESPYHGIELFSRNGGGYGVSDRKDDVDTTAFYNALLWLVFCFIVYIFWKEFRQSETGCRLSRTSHDESIPGSQAGKVSDRKDDVDTTALYNVLLRHVFCFIVYILLKEFRQNVSDSKDEVDTTELHNVLLWLVFCFIVCILWKEFRQSETGYRLSRTSHDESIPGSQAGKVSDSKDDVDTTALYNVLLRLVFRYIVYIFWKEFRQSDTSCRLSRTRHDEPIPGSQAGKLSDSKDEVNTTALYNVLLCLVFCFIVYIFWKEFRQCVSDSKDEVDTTALYNVLLCLVFCFIVYIFWKKFCQYEKFKKKIEELRQEIAAEWDELLTCWSCSHFVKLMSGVN